MKEEIQTETRYEGYFLMDSGIKVSFDMSEDEGDEEMRLLYGNLEFTYEKGGVIWLGESTNMVILVDRIIGFSVREYQL